MSSPTTSERRCASDIATPLDEGGVVPLSSKHAATTGCAPYKEPIFMKLPAMLGVLALAFALAACGSPASEGANAAPSSTDANATSSAHLVLESAPD